MQQRVFSSQKKMKANSDVPKKINQRVCVNHPNKKGKYQCIPPNDQLKSKFQKNYYCSKCTITYLAQNYEMVEPEDEDESPKLEQQKFETLNNHDQNQRFQVINQTQQQVNQILKETKQLKNLVTTRKSDTSYWYENQIIKLENTFDQVQRIIEQIKIKQFSNLKTHSQSILQQFSQVEQNLEQNIGRMDLFLQDIQTNTEVINQIENKQFKQVIKQQQDNLLQYQNYNKEVNQYQIQIESVLTQQEIDQQIKALTKCVNDIFIIKKKQRNLTKSYQEETLQQTPKGHEKNNSDIPRNIIFNNEEQKRNTIEIIRQAKKKSLTELSPLCKKEGYHRDSSNNSLLINKENSDLSNRQRSITPTNFDQFKKKLNLDNQELTPTHNKIKKTRF